jgi:hypothetical protein
MAIKYGQIAAIALIGALTLGSISAMGLLQSTERIGSSGIIVRPVSDPIYISPSPSPSPPPPEPSIEIDIYSDPECRNVISNVEWGEIESGGSSDVQVYVKNNGDVSVIISFDTENWSSSTAESNMVLSWDYDGVQIQPREIRAVTLTLRVDSNCPELSSFGFNIVIIGS